MEKPKPKKPVELNKMNVSEWIRCDKADFNNGKFILMFKDERNFNSLLVESETILKE